ncbi:hypothetical protein Ccrd_004245 [Cynara cardunculus var. scolymus]|uniref:Uncharacterized protein n=1 Tax=Cynara cardunculus var. scolymus TaxID=59895 RepID=A0A103XN74_CYNCS|nr:hypothetical protein Ccrd_004245 [Cynara cardunculus var. scolymus]
MGASSSKEGSNSDSANDNNKGSSSNDNGDKRGGISGQIKAPNGGRSYISRAVFEGNPRGYVIGLRDASKGK